MVVNVDQIVYFSNWKILIAEVLWDVAYDLLGLRNALYMNCYTWLHVFMENQLEN